jgi:hypothetical protein
MEPTLALVSGNIRWIMLVSGLITLTMLYAVVAPEAAMLGNFGEAPGGPAAVLVVRNWGLPIALMGAMLIWGAFRPALRRPFLMIVGLSKPGFIGLVLAAGSRYLGHQAGIAIGVDAVFVVLFGLCLVAPDPAPT